VCGVGVGGGGGGACARVRMLCACCAQAARCACLWVVAKLVVEALPGTLVRIRNRDVVRVGKLPQTIPAHVAATAAQQHGLGERPLLSRVQGAAQFWAAATLGQEDGAAAPEEGDAALEQWQHCVAKVEALLQARGE
jgi:hypothetical protein